ncbi:MAG: SAM-dependent chlorinase/fluorinase [Alphaproteobacteria bacterium]|nr:SAM-dependent chlorinase/fluorinase [Alphaproteobacteria bacterium]
MSKINNKTKTVKRTNKPGADLAARDHDRKYVRVIADYGPLGDLAFAEVSDRLHAVMRDAAISDYKIDLTSVPAFDTYATGFALAQLAINSPLGKDHIFYVNTAPRKDKKSARINNEGEGLVYVRLKNGVQIVAVNSGYSLTFVKPQAVVIRELKVDKAGSQFRSRDIFPQAVAAVLAGDNKILGKDVSASVPGAVPENRVLYTDGYGNLKTSVRPADLKKLKGKHAYLKVGDADQKSVMVGTGIFDVADGDYCFARGSSGWAKPTGRERVEFSEVVCRGGNAAEGFDRPTGGKVLLWKPISR